MTAIRTEDLTKEYGHLVALEGLTLDVEAGEVFGFLGANGAGKTTTIRLLLDLLRPTRGRALVNGHDCHRDSLRARAALGYLPGEMPVYADMNGAQLLRFLARLEPRTPDVAWQGTLLARFGLGPAELARPLVHLSHGMKQKLGLVQALMGRAPVLVLDEPTAGLDPLMIEAFCETVTELRRQGHAVFLSSHVLSEVERLCDRLALVAQGRLVKVAAIDEIRRELPRRVRLTFNRAVPLVEGLHGIDVIASDDREWRLAVRGELGPLLARIDSTALVDVDVENFRLEDYILDLYESGR
jgi:ABC-2 type transport system ATP-binding protein